MSKEKLILKPLLDYLIKRANPAMAATDRDELIKHADKETEKSVAKIKKELSKAELKRYLIAGCIAFVLYFLKAQGLDLPIDPVMSAILEHLITLGSN